MLEAKLNFKDHREALKNISNLRENKYQNKKGLFIHIVPDLNIADTDAYLTMQLLKSLLQLKHFLDVSCKFYILSVL